jgi:hypothetical protein
MDGEHLEFDAEAFDTVISRVGLIYQKSARAAPLGAGGDARLSAVQ